MGRTCGFRKWLALSALVATLLLLPAGMAGASPASCDCPITINDYSAGLQDRAASPYPSRTSGVADAPPIDKVTVTLTGLTHEALDNVDVLLVSLGTGEAVELMSDAGGPLPAALLNLTFDDAATLSLPQAVTPPSGTYKPTNYAGTPIPCVADSPPNSRNSDPFPPAAPPPPAGGYSESLASFHGIFNGGFRLFVGDDCAGGTGSISSWSVNVTHMTCWELCLIKKADDVTVDAGSAIGFTLRAYNGQWYCPEPFPEFCDVNGVTLNDSLPAGPGINWSISPPYTGPGTCEITGAVGSQTLSCSFGDFPFATGGGALVHISSSTTTASCRTYANTATATSLDGYSVEDTHAITVTGCPTTVGFRSFDAARSARGVALRWRTASEARLLGFNLYRELGRRLVRLNRALVQGRSGRTYSWIDRTAPTSGTLKYRLQAVGLDGSRRWLGRAVVPR